MDGDVLDGIVLTNAIDDILSLGCLAVDSVHTIKVRSWAMSDEELGAVGIGSGISHGENTRLVVATVRLAFAFELVTRAAGASSSWATTLDHEVRNDAMKGQAVIVSSRGQVEERCDCDGGVIREGGDIDIAFVGVDGDFNVVHEAGRLPNLDT